MARNTTFTFYSNVNLNMRTNDNFYFANRTAQDTYFAQKVLYTISNLSYQRAKIGRVRVDKAYNLMYKCDYLSFINADYENKRFYAFVTDVKYISDNTTELSYVIDYVQTWLLDATVPNCFIDRCHTNTDNIGDNLIEDAMNCGEYIDSQFTYNSSTTTIIDGLTTTMYVIVCATFDIGTWISSDFATKNATSTWIKNGIYDNLSQMAFLCDDGTNMATTNSALQIFFNKVFEGAGGVTQNDIINIYMMPSEGIYVKTSVSSDHDPISVPGASQQGFTYCYYVGGRGSATVNLPACPNNLDGYTPKNNKMFTWPYVLMHISNNDGSAIDLKYERFRNNVGAIVSPTAKLQGCSTIEAKIRLTPENYLGQLQGGLSYDNAIDTAPFPTVSMTGDAYNIYLAQNRNRILNGYSNLMLNTTMGVIDQASSAATQAVTGMAGAEIGAYTNQYNYQQQAAYAASRGREMGPQTMGSQSVGGGSGQTYEMGLAKTAMGVMMQIRENMAVIKDMKVAPATASGITGVGLAYQNGKRDFTITVKTIDSAHAKMIDNYYTMYGYPIKSIGAINMRARTQYTYIKTIGCVIKGNLPEDAKEVLSGLFDAGIRLWTTPANIGDYSVTNPPYVPSNNS